MARSVDGLNFRNTLSSKNFKQINQGFPVLFTGNKKESVMHADRATGDLDN
jgi:hypothetical protein